MTQTDHARRFAQPIRLALGLAGGSAMIVCLAAVPIGTAQGHDRL